LLQAEAILQSKKPNIHIDDLQETQARFGEGHKQSLVLKKIISTADKSTEIKITE
jgi:hypothetical protein